MAHRRSSSIFALSLSFASLTFVAGPNALAAARGRGAFTPVRDARLAHVSDYQLGYVTREEALLESQPDAAEFLELFPQLDLIAGTYGLTRGSPYTRLADIWAQATQEKLQHFRLLLLYNVAEKGPLAQTVRVYSRPADARFDLTDLRNWSHESTWPISSGVGGAGKIRTFTGLYKIHPGRMTLNARAWGPNDPMPHSMYIHYFYCADNRWAGVATHGTPFERNLGRRASSGCLRLSRANAASLFERVRSDFRGLVPRVNYCNGRQQLESGAHLEMVRDASGQPVLEDGYQVLFVIHDDPTVN